MFENNLAENNLFQQHFAQITTNKKIIWPNVNWASDTVIWLNIIWSKQFGPKSLVLRHFRHFCVLAVGVSEKEENSFETLTPCSS